MKAKELAEILLKTPELEVLVDGYESGFDAAVDIVAVKTTPNPYKREAWWEGDFNKSEDGDIRLVILGTRGVKGVNQ